ncbi:MAG: DNA-3-methyladenine glycosylase [Thermoanaerobaculia bacterium]
MIAERRLKSAFFARAAEEVARDLLGRHLVRELPAGRIVARLVETEAYCGPHDRASHTFGGRRTPRNESMYLGGGHAYVYRIYGIHFCLNVVTGAAGEGIAVLLRAAEIVEGETLVRLRRPGPLPSPRLLAGPGNLTRGLDVDLSLDGVRLDRGALRLEAGEVYSGEILCGPRVGCESAGEAADWPLRFTVAGSAAVSRPWPKTVDRAKASSPGGYVPPSGASRPRAGRRARSSS